MSCTKWMHLLQPLMNFHSGVDWKPTRARVSFRECSNEGRGGSVIYNRKVLLFLWSRGGPDSRCSVQGYLTCKKTHPPGSLP